MLDRVLTLSGCFCTTPDVAQSRRSYVGLLRSTARVLALPFAPAALFRTMTFVDRSADADCGAYRRTRRS